LERHRDPHHAKRIKSTERRRLHSRL